MARGAKLLTPLVHLLAGAPGADARPQRAAAGGLTSFLSLAHGVERAPLGGGAALPTILPTEGAAPPANAASAGRPPLRPEPSVDAGFPSLTLRSSTGAAENEQPLAILQLSSSRAAENEQPLVILQPSSSRGGGRGFTRLPAEDDTVAWREIFLAFYAEHCPSKAGVVNDGMMAKWRGRYVRLWGLLQSKYTSEVD